MPSHPSRDCVTLLRIWFITFGYLGVVPMWVAGLGCGQHPGFLVRSILFQTGRPLFRPDDVTQILHNGLRARVRNIFKAGRKG
jgi:hypothetical protein